MNLQETGPRCTATDDVSADPCIRPAGHDGLHVAASDDCTCYLGNPEDSTADEEACAACDAEFWRNPVFRPDESPEDDQETSS